MHSRRLRQLQNRFIAVNMRSRSLRLTRTSQSGALDLFQVQTALPHVWATLQKSLGQESKPIPLVTLLPPTEELSPLTNGLDQLERAARADWMETGARNLAVGWPILEGKAADGTWLRAPLLLYGASIDIDERGMHKWTLTLTDPPELNQSLAQVLRRASGFHVSMEEVLSFDEDKVMAMDNPTWKALLHCFRSLGLSVDGPEELPPLSPLQPRNAADRDRSRTGEFHLSSQAILGRFPRSGSNVALDYDELLRRDTLHKLGLARDILEVDEDTTWEEGEALEDQDDAPQTSPPEKDLRRWQILPSDSSQDAVFHFLQKPDARGIVVQGPPGTGKSQLITNLIGAAIAEGKRLLLVCQKRAALDVVAERLATSGLREPVAVVHDVQRDRNAVCDAIASTIDAARDRASHPNTAQDPHYGKARRALNTRLDASQASFNALTKTGPKPCLALLQERALEDDGRPLPNLTSFAENVEEEQAHALHPRLDSLSRASRPFAAPHPLAARKHWARCTPEDLLNLKETLQHLRKIAQEHARGPGILTPGQSEALLPVWKKSSPLLDDLEAENGDALDAFLLFWVWTNGQTESGEWAQTMQILREASRTLQFTPHELVTQPRARLNAWIADLQRLKTLRGKWYRLFLPEFWRLRKTPGEVLDACDSLRNDPNASSALVDLEDLCKRAIPWQDLIQKLPDDNPVLDFGFQGDPADISLAIEDLSTQHDRVLGVHKLQEALSTYGPPYDALPELDPTVGMNSLSFFNAALQDRARISMWAEAKKILDTMEPHWQPELLRTCREHLKEGQFQKAHDLLDTILCAWNDAARVSELDEAIDQDPPWVRHFLRHWNPKNPHARASQDATTALERAWTRLALSHQPASALEASLVDPTQLQTLDRALHKSQTLAGKGILNHYHQRLAEIVQSKSRSKALRKLASEARKKRNRLTLRQLVEGYWDKGLSRTRPVWFCSPDSVAALFPLQEDLFDLVIFDEASQCPVEAAIPTLARTRSAIIAGDDQQMPPSHFFRASTEDDEDEGSAILASHSLLALARVAFQDTTLRWHYRSRHEELVAFSNAAFYGNRLITAPRRDGIEYNDIEGLHWHQVRGLWVEQRNHKEAEKVVDLALNLMASQGPGGTPPSLGIITFNRKQASLIQEKLRHRATTDRDAQTLLARNRQRPPTEQLFVRNLENVQGDERDVILFSVGYGPKETGGKIAARFGPLGQEGGEKRLNVAITRARLGIGVVCSFNPDSLSVAKTKHVGPRLFKLYLQYVRNHAEGRNTAAAQLDTAQKLGQGEGVTGTHRNTQRRTRLGMRVQAEIATALRAAGLVVETDLGLGSQRLDIAVKTPEDTSWRLGIDCSEFLHNPDPLSRDIYTPRFWNRLGWKVLRITASMWKEQKTQLTQNIVELCQ